MKKILLISTGGTIACQETGHGLSPEIQAEEFLKEVDLKKWDCQVECLAIMNVDSTNMTPDKMSLIAETIYKHYKEYDGFIVTHGTDTMAYSASMVTYMLPGLNKAVVFTGSQLPVTADHTDAIANLETAFEGVCQAEAGVYIAFYGKLLPGVRSKKWCSKAFDAFHCVEDLQQKRRMSCLEKTGQNISLKNGYDDRILLFHLFPGMSPALLENLSEKEYKAVIVLGYGVGNVPGGQYSITNQLISLREKGIIVILSTQCFFDGTSLGTYEVSNTLTEYDMIDGGDMTVEALTMKCMWGLGNLSSIPEMKKWIETPYCGDRTI